MRTDIERGFLHVHEIPACDLRSLLLPALAQAADITGIPKIREGDQIQIGNTRIRLGGIDAPSVDQLCLNTKGERWTCGVAARDELIHHADNKSWTCHVRQTDRRGRTVARCEVDGEDIQKWLVQNGWALSYTRVSHDYDADEKAAREAKAGMWQGAFIAPWDWRVRNKKTTILGATKPPPRPPTRSCWRRRRDRSRPRRTAPSRATSTAPANASITRPTSRWYAQIKMQISKGTRWFCSVEEAEAAGCRETKR